MTDKLELYTNLNHSPDGKANRSILQGQTLICAVLGSATGYLQGGIYFGKYPVIERWDGLNGNQLDLDGKKDTQDGVVEIPTFHKFSDNLPVIDFPPGTYTLHIEAARTPGEMVPTFFNVEFDILPVKK